MRALENEILHQFADDMFGIGAASAVSANKKSTAIDKNVFQCRVYGEKGTGYSSQLRDAPEKFFRMLVDIVADRHDNLSVDSVFNIAHLLIEHYLSRKSKQNINIFSNMREMRRKKGAYQHC